MAVESTIFAEGSGIGRVLIIDDDTAVRFVLSAYLEGLGQISTAATKSEALEKLGTGSYDVVVTDVLLPDGDGIDILNHIYTRGLAPRVVCVTGGSRYIGPAFFRRVAETLGATVLQKPFGRREFVAAVTGTAPTDAAPVPSEHR